MLLTLTVAVGHSDALVAALRAAAAAVASSTSNASDDELRFTRYTTAPPCITKAGDRPGHGSYELAYAERELYTWLLAHQRHDGGAMS